MVSLKEKIIKTWKCSKIRFYIKNTIWNYKFWVLCKRKYEDITYFEKDFFRNNKNKVIKRRFVGYEYKGKIYLDNPGLQDIEKYVWDSWKRKKLI